MATAAMKNQTDRFYTAAIVLAGRSVYTTLFEPPLLSTEVALCSYDHGRNHLDTMNGAIAGRLGAGHGMAERDAAGCRLKSSPVFRAVLNSVAKFVHCVQTLESHLDKAEIANFGLQKRCKTQNAHKARPRPSSRDQKAVAHVVWTQIPSIVLPPGQMAKCENCNSVHWQRQQSSIKVCKSETGVEKSEEKMASTHRPSSVGL